MASVETQFRLPANADQMIRDMASAMLPPDRWQDLYRPSASVLAGVSVSVEGSPKLAQQAAGGPKGLPELSAIGVAPISPADSLGKAFSQLAAIYAHLMDSSFITARQVAGEVGQIKWVPENFAPAWEGAKGAREHSLLILARKVIQGARADAADLVRAGHTNASAAEAEMHNRLSLRCAVALQFGATYLGPRGAFFLVEALSLSLPSVLHEARVPDFLSGVINHRLARPDGHSPARWQRYVEGMLLVANSVHATWTEDLSQELFKAQP